MSKTSGTHTNAWKDRYPIVFVNNSGEAIPAYAVVQVSNAATFGGTRTLDVIKPTGSASAKYLFNAPGTVPYPHGGMATDLCPIDALITGTPTLNQEIGPVNGSWALSVNGKGFTYLGGLASGIGRVAVKSGDDFPLVRIVNVSGLPRVRGSIVGYGPVVDAWGSYARVPTFQSAPPTAGRPFAVLLTDLGVGNTGDAAPVGTAETVVNVTNATHEFAEAITNDYSRLASATSGQARILARQLGHLVGGSSLGPQWARVRLDPLSAAAVADDPCGEVYTVISKAVKRPSGNVRPGNGLVTLFIPPQSGAIASEWQPGPPVACETWMAAASTVGKPVIIRKSRLAPDGSQIYKAIAEGCGSWETVAPE